MRLKKEKRTCEDLGAGRGYKKREVEERSPSVGKVALGTAEGGWRQVGGEEELGSHLQSPKASHLAQLPILSRPPFPPCSRPPQAPSAASRRPVPHPGTAAWECSTGPDYRCSWSCPQDGSQGHIGNPPGLRPERGGPHP